MASLASAYAPRRPTETVLYELVRQHLESFLAFTREHYEGGLPRYVEQELRAYLKCGVFSEGFTRAHCDACGHDLLVAFSCHGRSVCPSCCGRRMANIAAHLVDRVLPDVPVRQYVLSLPYELRRLAAFKADVLTALARNFVEAISAVYRSRAKRAGVDSAQCGSVTFVQRFGSLNLNVHFHVLVLDGVFARDAGGLVQFHAAPAPAAADLEAIVARAQRRCVAWLRRHGHLEDRAIEDRSNEIPAQTAIEGCAAIATGRGNVATLARESAGDARSDDEEERADRPTVAVERDGFNLHAGVRIEAGDDLGRERLARYGARPPLSLERLRRLPGGRVAYRLKYLSRGRGKHRVMSPMEFMARLAAIICPPRYPLVRYAGVLGPRSAWRKDVVPKPRERTGECNRLTARSRHRDPTARRAHPRRTARTARTPGATHGHPPIAQRRPEPRSTGVDRASRASGPWRRVPPRFRSCRRTSSRYAIGSGCRAARCTPRPLGSTGQPSCAGRSRWTCWSVQSATAASGSSPSSPSATRSDAYLRIYAYPPMPLRWREPGTRPTTRATRRRRRSSPSASRRLQRSRSPPHPAGGRAAPRAAGVGARLGTAQSGRPSVTSRPARYGKGPRGPLAGPSALPLPTRPQVHDTRRQGRISLHVEIARRQGRVAYVGEGKNRVPAAHVSDVVRLFRLALEKGEPGARYHAVSEEGVPLRDIAEAIGAGLKMPVESITPDDAPRYFGAMAGLAALDIPASGAATQERLDWRPRGPTLLTDLRTMDYGAP